MVASVVASVIPPVVTASRITAVIAALAAMVPSGVTALTSVVASGTAEASLFTGFFVSLRADPFALVPLLLEPVCVLAVCALTLRFKCHWNPSPSVMLCPKAFCI